MIKIHILDNENKQALQILEDNLIKKKLIEKTKLQLKFMLYEFN